MENIESVIEWEYDRWYFHHDDDIVGNLNCLGRSRFELVSVIPNPNGDGAWYIFKRVKQEAPKTELPKLERVETSGLESALSALERMKKELPFKG